MNHPVLFAILSLVSIFAGYGIMNAYYDYNKFRDLQKHNAEFYYQQCMQNAKQAHLLNNHNRLETIATCVNIADHACRMKGCSENVDE